MRKINAREFALEATCSNLMRSIMLEDGVMAVYLTLDMYSILSDIDHDQFDRRLAQ
jgi:hypothetical protein